MVWFTVFAVVFVMAGLFYFDAATGFASGRRPKTGRARRFNLAMGGVYIAIPAAFFAAALVATA